MKNKTKRYYGDFILLVFDRKTREKKEYLRKIQKYRIKK
jgi:hypothetical protein